MATTRIRKAFKYPEDDQAEDSAPQGLDEQEQEDVIKNLARHDAEISEFWRQIISIAIYAVAAIYALVGVWTGTGIQIAGGLSIGLSGAFVDSERWRLHQLRGPASFSAWIDGLDLKFKLFVEPLPLANLVFIAIMFLASNDRTGLRAPWPTMIMYIVSLSARWFLEPVSLEELEKLKYVYKGA